jgi:predicted esterase
MSETRSLDRFEDAEHKYKSGRYAEALKILDTLDTAHPNNKNIVYAQARCLYKMGKTEQAAELSRLSISKWDSPRAKVLLENINRQGSSNDVDNTSWISLEDTPEKLKSPGIPAAKLIIIFAGVVAISYTAYFYPFDNQPNTKVATMEQPIESPLRLNGFLNWQTNDDDDRSETPGVIIPEHVWKQNSANGIPRWRPGVYERISCKGTSVTMPTGNIIPRTINVYIPMAYQERPDAQFPVVFINGSHIHPGFLKLQDWAEKNQVILVTVNLVGNGIFEQNHISQDEAVDVVKNSMRSVQKLFFAIGGSGGAKTSWEMICRYPDHFAGVVMMAMNRGRGDWLPRHIRVAYIYGETDFNRAGIESTIPYLQKYGNPLQVQMVPGGHVSGPLEVREKMLSWMLKDAILERVRENRIRQH